MLKINTKLTAIFLWAFACGTPLFLITSTLSVRLAQARLNLTEIGLFSLAVSPYALKFIFAPIIENTSPPFLTTYVGRARAWMLFAMTGIVIGIILMAICTLQTKLDIYWLFIAALFTGFCGAINDTAEAEYRIELLEPNELSYGTACYTAGFTLGELTAGGGTLIIANYYHWKTAYIVMIIPLLIGIITVSFKKHQQRFRSIANVTSPLQKTKHDLSAFINPIKNLLQRIHSKWMLLLIFIYYAPSYLLLMITNPFYLQLKFPINQIGFIKGLPTLFILLIGSLIGGYLCKRHGMLRGLAYSTTGYLVNIVIFLLLCLASRSLQHPYFLLCLSVLFTTLIDSVSVVFYIALIASECRNPYTASQNALLTSLMALSKVIFATLGGWMAQHLGYENTFIVLFLATSILGLWVAQLSTSRSLQQTI